MEPLNAFEMFEKNSPWLLKRRIANGEYVGGRELADVLQHHPGSASDPDILDYNRRLLRGEIKKPKGRPPMSLGRKARIFIAGEWAKEDAAEYRAKYGTKPAYRGAPSPLERAYRLYGLELGMSGPALANAVSSLKTDWLFGDVVL